MVYSLVLHVLDFIHGLFGLHYASPRFVDLVLIAVGYKVET